MDRLTDQPSMTERLTVVVRDAIRRGDLAPGRLYSAQELGELFGVSRTPVREALLKLADAGLVRIERNRGARILHSTDRDVIEVFWLRLQLEPPASARAAGRADFPIAELTATLDQMHDHEHHTEEFFRADRAFHDVILQSSGNARLVGIVRGLRDAITLQGRATVPRVRGAHQIIEEHRAIVDAIEARSPRRAADAMREHLLATAALLVENVTDWETELRHWGFGHDAGQSTSPRGGG